MRLSGWHVPTSSLSATSIAKFIQCPEQWRLRYLQKQPDRVYSERFIGIVEHDAWEYNFKAKVQDGEDLGSSWVKSYMNANIDMLVEKNDPELAEGELDSIKTLVEKMIDAYEPVAQIVTPIAVEERFEERIPGVPVPLIGYIDVEEPEQIIDRKTSKNRMSKPKSGWRFQGRIYQLVKRKPIEWHVITKQAKPQVVTAQQEPGLLMRPVNADVTVNMIQQAAHSLNDLYCRYGADSPWPQNGVFGDWLCNYCFAGPRYAASCVAWKENDVLA